MILYGGVIGDFNNNEIFALDLKTYKWTIIKTTGDAPESRDDHSACIEGDTMVVFGGFVRGTRANDVYTLNLSNNVWNKSADGG